jgi:hypothetical protein
MTCVAMARGMMLRVEGELTCVAVTHGMCVGLKEN